MGDIISFLFNDNSWGRIMLPLMTVLIAISYGYLLNSLLKKKRETENRNRSDFIEKARSAFEQHSLVEIGDIKTLFEGVFKKDSEEDGNRKFGLLLKELYAVIVSDKSDKNSIDYSKLLRTFINDLQINEPFEGVPDPERTILKDALSFVNANNQAEIKRKLYEVSNAISGRHNTILELQASGKKNWTITTVSIVITVISIVISILTWIFK